MASRARASRYTPTCGLHTPLTVTPEWATPSSHSRSLQSSSHNSPRPSHLLTGIDVTAPRDPHLLTTIRTPPLLLQYPESVFKIATFNRLLVILSGRGMVGDLRKRPVDELSAPRGFQENFQSKYVFERAVLTDRYHGEVAKKLLKKLPTLLPDVIDEVFVAVDDNIPIGGSEWESVDVAAAIGRNEEYLAHAVGFATHFSEGAGVLRVVPDFIKRSLVAPFVIKAKDDIARAVPLLRPIIEERMNASAKLGKVWDGKPVITHALYHIAENPALATSLREEAQTCISANGWTGTALGSMRKLHSLLRETLRHYGVGLPGVGTVTMTRKVLKDIALPDGIHLSAGTLVSANAHSTHHDLALLGLEHADTDTFDPLRYARMRSGVEGQNQNLNRNLKYQFASTSPEYIPFGHGPRACSGETGRAPPNACVSLAVVPARDGRVLFKKREV
ncbi:cytochrome P450 [Ganoderma sinense ZZ0214-1]|uniref:Cytochrome P450 n=1 Tax=Ganoderma sinense ZZ0214-1 TaxID=1077348 RepID=A0A2G8S924_9APHY|nr:cytochrome P450 [Ganoderma sinense ZZ0214-1]